MEGSKSQEFSMTQTKVISNTSEHITASFIVCTHERSFIRPYI
jgi:hypothetical protein